MSGNRYLLDTNAIVKLDRIHQSEYYKLLRIC